MGFWLKSAVLTLPIAAWSTSQRSAVCQTVETQVAAHFRAGEEELKKGELTSAGEEFKKVLALDPDLVEAYVNLGLVYHSLGEFTLAASNLSEALRRNPNLPGPTVILGVDYLKPGQEQKAIPVLRRALRLDPSNLEARRALAACYRSGEDLRDAAYQKPSTGKPESRQGGRMVQARPRLPGSFRPAGLSRSPAVHRLSLGTSFSRRYAGTARPLGGS